VSQPNLEPITLYPDRRPAIALVLLGLSSVLLGAWLSWSGWGVPGVAAMVAGAVVALGALIWLIPSRAYLHLTDRSFIYCTAFNPRRVDWADIDRFGVVQEAGGDRVAWDYAPHYPADSISREQTKKRTGFEAILPQCCRMGGNPLAELLDRRKRQATS
jgi:hypothetical protein